MVALPIINGGAVIAIVAVFVFTQPCYRALPVSQYAKNPPRDATEGLHDCAQTTDPFVVCHAYRVPGRSTLAGHARIWP